MGFIKETAALRKFLNKETGLDSLLDEVKKLPEDQTFIMQKIRMRQEFEDEKFESIKMNINCLYHLLEAVSLIELAENHIEVSRDNKKK